MAQNIDYTIHGDDMQFVEVLLDPNETMIAEAGSMMMMDNPIEMATTFGDGSSKGGGFMDKLFSAGKRVVTGESLFMTTFTNMGYDRAMVSFAAPYPGKILPIQLSQYNGTLICQKESFLCAQKGTQIGIEFTKKFGAGIFGGEGFILQKLQGDGLAFVHAGGTILEKELYSGQILKIDTGCIVAMTTSVDYDIQFVGGIKNALFGGEGLFFATLKGPGKVWIQSLPFSRLASRVMSASMGGRAGREEGSILGGLGNFLDGDGF
ncbi:TIGR00266 family protein [Clostridium sp. YIM B02506]|uniref:TIGR00266 family protein n=1 Tax=Clostridium sp. YIM B02506 TaxID=2910680 RepID=UPI001EEED6F1|nr:TIGR00266 family protein [Clostridium sp. YIM B02506]